MPKYKVIMHYSDGTNEELDDIFENESDADEYGQYMCSCYHQGYEVLNLSNPGDYPLENEGDADYEVIEIDD